MEQTKCQKCRPRLHEHNAQRRLTHSSLINDIP